MAFDYTGANTGVFTRLGKIIKYINSRLATATTTLPAELKAIADLYEAADLTGQINRLYDLYDAMKANVVNERQQLATFLTTTLLDRDTVLTQLIGSPAADINAVLAALFTQMQIDGKTIKRSTTFIASYGFTSSNTGNGTVLISTVLDGYNPPLQGALNHLGYDGLNTELAASETHTLVCIGDSMREGTAEGAERFSWTGSQPTNLLDYRSEGSGPGPTLTVAGGTSLVTDGNFENWSNNTPSSWTIDNGIAGTHIFQENEASNVYRGAASVKFLGTGTQATIGISQAISTSTIKSRRRYLAAVRFKASAVPASGQFEMHFAGTGFTKTAPINEVQDIQIGGSPTGGTYTLFWSSPSSCVPSQTTAPIPYNANSATVQAALRALTGLESVVVTTQAGTPPNVTHRITFHGLPGDVGNVSADINGLTGGSPTFSFTPVTQGIEGNCVILPAAAFPTSWKLLWFWINMPSIIPSNWKLVLQITGTLSNTVAVYMDNLVLAEAVYHGGIACVVVPGSTRFIDGDRFTFTTVNNDDGVFQKAFRQIYKFQLPSSSSPNISDSLAT